MMLKLFLILIFLVPALGFAQVKKNTKVKRQPAQTAAVTPLYIGHNLTPSTDILAPHSYTIGTYAAGFGLTENLFIATSPWIWYSYNTTNLHLKYSQVISPQSTVGFFLSYFDSYNSKNLMNPNNSFGNGGPGTMAASTLPPGTSVSQSMNRYQWTSYSAHALYSYRYENGVTQYFNLKYSYYLNDDMPYSLRMDPGDDNIRDQIDTSTLLKIPVKDGLSVALETGLLGLNYIKPYAHMGASLAIQKQDWLIQVGASYTVAVDELGTSAGTEIGRMDNRVHYSEIAHQYYTERYLQVAVHPEVQLQFNF